LGLEGGERLATVGHGLPGAREILTREVVVAVVDVRLAEVGAVVAVLVGNPGVLAGVVEDGLDRGGTHILVHFSDLHHHTLVDNSVRLARPQVKIVVLDVVHVVNQALGLPDLGGAHDVVDVDELGGGHTFESVGDHTLRAVVGEASDDAVGVDLGGEGNAVLDRHGCPSRDT